MTEEDGEITEVNAFWMTWLVAGYNVHRSVPLDLVKLSWDNRKNRPLYIVPDMKQP